MKYCVYLLLFLLPAGLYAQSPRITVLSDRADSVPFTVTVPVQENALHLSDRITDYAKPGPHADRQEKKQWQRLEKIATTDSLIQSRDFLFFPLAMQRTGGKVRPLRDGDYCLALWVDTSTVHLPVESEQGRMEDLNFEASVSGHYHYQRLQNEDRVSFRMTDGQTNYHVDISVQLADGEAHLTLYTPTEIMRYTGYVSRHWSEE